MSDFYVIDAHIHTYQTREVGLQAKQGSIITDYAGTIDELLPIMEKANISKAVMVNMLPLAEMRKAAVDQLPPDLSEADRNRALRDIDERLLGRLERRNAWTCNLGKDNPGLIPFINLDPLQDETAMKAELVDRVDNHGAKGIKLHPGSQWFYPNDRRLWPAYSTAQELGLPVVFHSGHFLSPEPYSQPKNFVEVLDTFPELVLVMAHLGFGYVEEAISLAKTYPSLQFDCSAIISAVQPDGELTEGRFIDIVREVGVDRVMFGSDFPWYDPADSVDRLLGMGFSDREKQLLFAENAIRIFRLEAVC